jgi:hypothetical protein
VEDCQGEAFWWEASLSPIAKNHLLEPLGELLWVIQASGGTEAVVEPDERDHILAPLKGVPGEGSVGFGGPRKVSETPGGVLLPVQEVFLFKEDFTILLRFWEIVVEGSESSTRIKEGISLLELGREVVNDSLRESRSCIDYIVKGSYGSLAWFILF